ncbi:MAG: zinc ribbon domain-containing protein, partial [Oscillospiraceae bacterium]
KHAQQKNADFMLRGLVRCSSCGSTLVQAVKGKSLQCHKYARGQCEVSHSITISKINEAVLEKLESDLENCEFEFEIRKDPANETDSINSILLEKEYKKLERVKEAFEAGIDTLEEYKLNKARIQNRITELEKDIPKPSTEEITEKIKESISDILIQLRDNSVSENEKNTLLRSIISGIVFDKKNMTIQIKYHSVYNFP